MRKPQPASENRYYVLYRSGGTHYCHWTRLLEVYTYPEGVAKQAEMERMGYRSLVQSIGQLSRIGMPYGWDSQSVNWSEDETTTEYDRNEKIGRASCRERV